MGTFMGHFIPGFFFITFSLWWAVNMFIRFNRQHYRKVPYKATATFPCLCCGRCKNWPFEGLLKIVATTFGLVGEVITGWKAPGYIIMGNSQHITMFFFYGLTGLIDILIYYRFPLPKNSDFVAVLIAVVIELVLFRFHLHGREELDIHVHMLLVYLLSATVVILLIEMWKKNSALASLAKSWAVFVQGTWFIQVGFILYNPIPSAKAWDQDDPESIMLVTIYFAWHMGLSFVIYLMLGLLISCVYRRCGGHSACDHGDEVAMQRLITKDANGKTRVRLDNDSDSELEYHRPVGQDQEE